VRRFVVVGLRVLDYGQGGP